jgi:hypothetical protein
MDQLLSKREISERLGVSEDFVRRTMKAEGLNYTDKQNRQIKSRVMLVTARRGPRRKDLGAGMFEKEKADRDKIIAASHKLALRCLKLIVDTHPDRRAA